ncbi:MAG: DCC1-like thiol-disulfide oxidoreductase family protein [Kiritimatiellia bacterium]
MLIEDGRAFLESTAALRIARGLRFPWPLLSVLLIVPRVLRDPVYRWIARHRYRWFGRREECWRPDDRWNNRFIA